MTETRKVDERHGGPYDRGCADSFYNRPRCPHYFEGGTNASTKISRENMSEEDIADYMSGYDWNEEYGDKKNWD